MEERTFEENSSGTIESMPPTPDNYQAYIQSLEQGDVNEYHEHEDILTTGFVVKSIIAFLLYASIFFIDYTATHLWMPAVRIVYNILPFHNWFVSMSGGDEAVLAVYQNMFINNFIYITLFLVIVPMFWKEIKHGVKKLAKEFWRIATIPAIYVVTIFSSAIVVGIANIIWDIPDTSINQESINASMAVSPWGNVFSTIIGAPFVEEIIFRVIVGGGVFMLLTTLFNKENNSKGKKVLFSTIAIIVSTVFFAWIHVSSGDYLAIFPYLVMGLSMTLTYFLSDRNVMMSIILHMVTNIIAFLVNM